MAFSWLRCNVSSSLDFLETAISADYRPYSKSSLTLTLNEWRFSFWIAGGLVLYLYMWLLTLQLFKNSIDTQEKLRLNFHSLSVLLEYGVKHAFPRFVK
jgi:hypothetical protein